MFNKSKIKKTSCTLLVVSLLVVMMFSFVHAEDNNISSGTCGEDVLWQLEQGQDGLRLTIYGSGPMTDYIEYEYIDLDRTYPLAPWDEYKDEITEVVIEDGITHIGGAAFYQETNIRSVAIPESVVSIGDYAFFGCTGLTELSLPSNLTETGYYSFSQVALAELDIPASLQKVRDYSFEACPNLSQITFHEGLTSIGVAAFSSCSALEEVYLPDGLLEIQPDAFDFCTALTKIVIPESVTEIGGSKKSTVFGFSKNVTICGISGSEADVYAAKFNIPFVSIEDSPVPIEDLHFQQPKISLANLESQQLFLDNDQIDRTDVVWSSNRPQVASVDEYGVVTANKYGKAKITAVLKDDNSIYDECTIQTLYSDVCDSSAYFYKPVYWAAQNKIVGGLNGGVSFGPDNKCTRRQLSILLWKMAGKPEPTGTMPFTDVTDDANTTGYKAMLWAYNNGIVKGYSDGTFRPFSPVTRKQAVIMLYRYVGKPDADGVSNFKDVSGNLNSDYLKAVSWGNQTGIVNGSNGMFKPQNNCLRKQLVCFLYRLNRYLEAN